MITESAFGMLTAAGTALLPYYLMLRPLRSTGEIDPSVANLIFILVFSAVPLAVSQTELSLANGSRYYFSESWPASLAGLGAQAAVVGLFYLLTNGRTIEHGEGTLLIGTVVFVPLVEMAVINLTKTPRWKSPAAAPAALLRWQQGQGVQAGLAAPSPLIGAEGMVGLQLPILSGRF